MSYSIVYSSKTGNTALLAQTLRECLGEESCLYFGPPSAQALKAQRIYVGFWTDKGTCDGETAQFLSTLTRSAAAMSRWRTAPASRSCWRILTVLWPIPAGRIWNI